MTIKVIKNPCCKNCGSKVVYAIPQIIFHDIESVSIDDEDGMVDNLDLCNINDAYDTDPSYFYCEQCEQIKSEDIIDESEWENKNDL